MRAIYRAARLANKIIGCHYLIGEEVKQQANIPVEYKKRELPLKEGQGLHKRYPLLPLT